jgi:hypothetical protein
MPLAGQRRGVAFAAPPRPEDRGRPAGFDLTPALQALIGWDRLAEMDRLVPGSFETPLGRKIPIDYDGEVPAIEVRLQEMFGVTQHPVVGAGGCRCR